MKITISIILILLSTHEAFSQYDAEGLYSVKDSTYIVIKSKDDMTKAWAEMLIRGTTGLPIFRFDKRLFMKYYKRLILSEFGLSSVEPKGNYIDHQKSLKTGRAVDLPIFDTNNVNIYKAMLNDYLNSHPEIRALKDSITNKPFYETWPWGKKELMRFIPLQVSTTYQSDVYQFNRMAIMSNAKSAIPDIVRSLKIKNAVNDQSLPAKFRLYLQNLIDKHRISPDDDIGKLMSRHDIDHSAFRLFTDRDLRLIRK